MEDTSDFGFGIFTTHPDPGLRILHRFRFPLFGLRFMNMNMGIELSNMGVLKLEQKNTKIK
jgi:hypothetical protein